MLISDERKASRAPGRSWRYRRDCPAGRIFEVDELAAADADGWQDHPWFDEPAAEPVTQVEHVPPAEVEWFDKPLAETVPVLEIEKPKRGPRGPRRKDE